VFSALFDWEGSLTPGVADLLKGQRGVDVPTFLQVWRRTQLEYTYVTTLLGQEFLKFETLTRRALKDWSMAGARWTLFPMFVRDCFN